MRNPNSPRKAAWKSLLIFGPLAAYLWKRPNGMVSSTGDDEEDDDGQGAYWGEFSSELAERLLHRARSEGYAAAVREVLPNPLHDYLLDESRSLFWPVVAKDLLGGTIYDLGAGWGALTAGLARTGATVVALERIPLRAQFLKLRLEQEGISNAHVVVGDVNALPFKESSADLIVANGLLEWVGTFSPIKSVRSAQLHFLIGCRRALKEQGSIYIGIENRWSALSLLGEKDHTGIWGTNLLPRRMASFAVKRQRMRFHGEENHVRGGHEGYRTFTYGLRGYRRLLGSAGLKTSFYLPIISYNRPWIMLPGRWTSRRLTRRLIDNMSPSNEQEANLMKLARLLSYLPFLEFVAPSYGIVATPSPNRPVRAKVGFAGRAWVSQEPWRADQYTLEAGHTVSRVCQPLTQERNGSWANYRWPGIRRFVRTVTKAGRESS